MKQQSEFRTADLKFIELCDEIDYWRERAMSAEEDARRWKDDYTKQINQSLDFAKKGVAQALMFALNTTDDENGNLVIKKDDRKTLTESYK